MPKIMQKGFSINERFLEDCIFDVLTSENGIDNLYDRGIVFDDNMKFFRQFGIPAHGIADIVGIRKVKNTLVVDIYELKAVTFKLEHLAQAYRYKAGIRQYIEWFNKKYKKEYYFKCNIFMVCQDFDDSDHFFLTRELINTRFYSYTFSPLKGLEFDEYYPSSWYKKSNPEEFNLPFTIKDIYSPSGIIQPCDDYEDIPF